MFSNWKLIRHLKHCNKLEGDVLTVFQHFGCAPDPLHSFCWPTSQVVQRLLTKSLQMILTVGSREGGQHRVADLIRLAMQFPPQLSWENRNFKNCNKTN